MIKRWIQNILYGICFICCTTPSVYATEIKTHSIIEIKDLRLGYYNHQFAFQSLLNIDPHPELLEAMNHGIQVYIIADIKIYKQDALLFNTTLQNTRKVWKIKYNAIIRTWQVETDDGHHFNEPSLKDCFNLFQGSNTWFIPASPTLNPNKSYGMAVRFSLTASVKPNPFNFNLYSNDHWFTSSPWKSTTFQISKLDFDSPSKD